MSMEGDRDDKLDLEASVSAEFERRRAERELQRDPAFRAAVIQLSDRMRQEHAAAAKRSGDELWANVERKIVALPQMREAAALRVVAAADEAAASQAVAEERAQPRWLGFMPAIGWSHIRSAATVLLALGVGFLGGIFYDRPESPSVVGVLEKPDASTPGAYVEAYGNGSFRVVNLQDFEVPDGKIMQLWRLHDEASPPVSMGTLPRQPEVRIMGPSIPTSPSNNHMYEITLEDAPGSLSGKPTGPVLAKGLANPAGR